MKKCPFCAEEIQDEAIICRFCNSSLAEGPQRVIAGATDAPAVAKTGPSSGAKTLAGISIACGVIGLLVFGIPLGIIAVACGIPAVSGGANNGKAGIVLGIIDIVLAVAILACSSS